MNLKAVMMGLLLFVLLYADAACRCSFCSIGITLDGIRAALIDGLTQWLLFLILGIYFITLFSLRILIGVAVSRRGGETGTQSGAKAKINSDGLISASIWILFVFLANFLVYTIKYEPSNEALILQAGAAVGQGFAFWISSGNKISPFSTFRLPLIMLAPLTLASVCNVDFYHDFRYYGHERFSGPWGNPNIFGVMMGVGIILAVANVIRNINVEFEKRRFDPGRPRLLVAILNTGLTKQGGQLKEVVVYAWRYISVILCVLALILMGCGLLHSYSRGAWCGTACGFLFLMWLILCRGQGERKGAERRLHLPGRPKGNLLIISSILSSIVLLSYWHFRRTDWRPAHRVFSAVNSADFSWRNRVAAWEGALQITAEHPGLGTGWNQPEPLFEHFYLPPKLTESAAIEMNDYLMLGAAIGIPALFCFGMYLWLSLTGKGGAQRGRGTDALHQEKTPAEIEDKTLISQVTVTSTRASETQTAYATVGWLQTTCRAGAVVLLVGFWFDGGLFNLATASTFWILLELGNVCQYEAHEMRENG